MIKIIKMMISYFVTNIRKSYKQGGYKFNSFSKWIYLTDLAGKNTLGLVLSVTDLQRERIALVVFQNNSEKVTIEK